MNRLLTIDEIKQTELSILDYIDSVCKQHNVRYYLAYGTLLGAIRHKGFIPWDDDIDIYMLRSDYDRFIQLLSAEKENHYSLLSIYNDSDYFYEFAKVVDNRTSINANNLKAMRNEGVWVDIFPLDNVPKRSSFGQTVQGTMARILRGTLSQKMRTAEDDTFAKKVLRFASHFVTREFHVDVF